MGSPARVVAREPYFPRLVSDVEKRTSLRAIVLDLVQFLRGHGILCRDLNGLFEFEVPVKSWLSRKPKVWHLRVAYGHPVDESAGSGLPGVGVFLSLLSIPQSIRNVCDRQGVTWIDVETKERSEHGNDAGEEVIHFLKRYGLRLSRVH